MKIIYISGIPGSEIVHLYRMRLDFYTTKTDRFYIIPDDALLEGK